MTSNDANHYTTPPTLVVNAMCTRYITYVISYVINRVVGKHLPGYRGVPTGIVIS